MPRRGTSPAKDLCMGLPPPRRNDDVVCFSHLRWGFVYQRPNHLMARCARDRRVFFFEEPIFEATAPALRTEEVAPNVLTAVPVLPQGLSPAEIADAEGALLHEMAVRFSIRRPLLWFYTPMALAFADRFPCSATVFDCMDELSAFDHAPPELVAREQALLARAQLVFTGGLSLYEAKRQRHPHVHAFPSSVDAAHFARANRPDVKEPEDQRSIGRPRLGFFGVIDERMDRDLLALLADAHPAWQIVLIGPIVKIDAAALPRRPNIHYLGPKSYAKLPDYLAGWDVAIAPFALNDATRFISPTKTLEYLAADRPVVSTPIRDIVHPYGDAGIVRIADRDGFVAAVEETLAESAEVRRARRVAVDAVLARTSWDSTWNAMNALIAAAVVARSGAAAGDASCTTI